MTVEQAIMCVKRLQSFYQHSKIDEAGITAYVQEIELLRFDDFCEGAKIVIRTSKFFPTVAELIEATDDACRKRFEKQEHDEREERLAIQGEDAIMDPKSEIHRVVVGPNHQKFLDMLSGKIQLPEPEWSIRSRLKKQAKEIQP